MFEKKKQKEKDDGEKVKKGGSKKETRNGSEKKIRSLVSTFVSSDLGRLFHPRFPSVVTRQSSVIPVSLPCLAERGDTDTVRRDTAYLVR